MNTVDPRQRSRVEQQIEHERIARRAYELFEARGRESGHAEEDWCLAEMDLRSCEGSPRTSSSKQRDRGRVCPEEDCISVKSAGNDAEQLRELAEEARAVRDDQREATETVRQEQERLRNVGETLRAAGEEARVAGEAARQGLIDALRATADTFKANLEQMKIVEEMRRALRDLRDVNTIESN
jgi:hypothetical protein